MKSKQITITVLMAICAAASAQETALPTDTVTQQQKEQKLGSAVVSTGRLGTKRLSGAENAFELNQTELFKAACCNLGESFTTNPSVDVNYSDAATGARQIRLLGLSGSYVQMLTENLPDFRGVAVPYALGYVPGPWMKSIQVSKGSASVRNGYESITGQINVEYLKPEDAPGVTANLYGDTEARLEANADANAHINSRLMTEVLGHYEKRWGSHDDNGDGFQDMPAVKQYNFQNRWIYRSPKYIFHGGLALIKEDRTSGQDGHTTSGDTPYRIGIATDRYEAYMKHALVLNPEHNTNLALMGTVSMHRQDATYGFKTYNVNQKNAYAQLLFETDITKRHKIAVGASLNHDYYGQVLSLPAGALSIGNAGITNHRLPEKETVPGAYAQYTFNLDSKLVLMAGLRADHSNLYGTFFTPRLHAKWQLTPALSLRASAGKGYRTVHPLAEYNYLLSSGRQLVITTIGQESAWNYGASAALTIPVAGKVLRLNAEYYYTRFGNQIEADYDAAPGEIRLGNMAGHSFSHTLQADASYDLFRGLNVTLAYRRNIVKGTYGGRLQTKPLASDYKGLFTASYKTPLGLWQFDTTLQLNGGGRLPQPYTTPDGTLSWPERFKAFPQLNVQISRWFRHFSIYIGGENLTGFKQKHPIIGADNPWSADFDPTLVWGPISDAMAYLGIRLNFGRL